MNLPEHLLNTKLCNKDTCEEIRTLKQKNQRLKEQCITYEQERERVLNKLEWIKENQRLKERIHDLLKENTEWKLENQRLNNVLNELKEWFKEFHKYQSRLKWNENDYIEFIEHLENELKESDK